VKPAAPSFQIPYRAGLRTALWVLAFGLFCLLPAAPAAGKSFVFTRVDIQATVGRDGSLTTSETRTYKFDGSFSWATRRVPLGPGQRMRDIRVSDERGAYKQASTRQPGTFETSRDRKDVIIRWGFSAASGSRTFTIAYTIDNVVTVYDDVAELYWKFIGQDWAEPSQDVRVTVRLPGQVPLERIRAWGHGPLHGDVRPTAGGALLTVRNLSAHTMVEGRITFPREVVPDARVRRSGPGLPRILKEEGDWANQANRTRLLQRVLIGGLSALPILALGGWLFLYLRYGREPTPAPPEGYYRELPASYSPAELGVLWRFGSVQPADFAATLLDLVRRGYMTVQTSTERGLLFSDDIYTLERTRKRDGLRPFEAEALAILYGHSEDTGERVAISRRKGLPAEAKTRMGRRFSSWTSMVGRAADAHGFFDGTSMKMRWVAIVFGFIVMGGGFWAAFALGIVSGISALTAAGFATGLSGLVLTAGSGAVRRRSQRGADDLRRWQGFRKFLRDFSEMERAELPSLVLWEHYLIYAVPLGVAGRVITQLRQIYPAEQLAQAPGLHTWASSSSGGRDPLAAFSAFTTSFAAATSSASSGSGSGGGFSGGGGGGRGGGGGSAG
jgi:uncharacterized membrane protein